MRSVAGLLHHLQALKPNLPDFDEQFLRGLRIYRAAQTKSQFLENSVSSSSWFKLEFEKNLNSHYVTGFPAFVRVLRYMQ